MAETPENYPTWRSLSPYVLVASVIVGFGVGIWVGTKRQAPPLRVNRIIENPTPPGSQGEVVIEEDMSGRLRGSVWVPKQSNNSGMPGKTDDGKGSGDFQATVLMKGEINTRYKVDGKVVGEGTHPVKGESVVTKKDDQLTVDTTFNDTVVVAVELEKPNPKLWRVGIYTAYDDDPSYGGYVQRNFKLMQTHKIDLYAFVKGEIEKDTETDVKIYAGLEANF